jgi:hypothetical protein
MPVNYRQDPRDNSESGFPEGETITDANIRAACLLIEGS